MHICPDLMTYIVGKDIDASDTIKLLNLAKKLKIKKFGLNTYNDPDLFKLHKGWPFKAKGSIFSTKQKRGDCPIVWKLIEDFKDSFSYNDSEWISGCGNTAQHCLPSIVGRKLNFITGIYTLSEDKTFYKFVAISDKDAEIISEHNKWMFK